MKDLRVFDLVVVHHRENATMWRVTDINGNRVSVIDAALSYAMPNVAPQLTDISLLKRPTKSQIDSFTAEHER